MYVYIYIYIPFQRGNAVFVHARPVCKRRAPVASSQKLSALVHLLCKATILKKQMASH